MKKNLLVLASSATIVALGLFLTSCSKDDDGPPAKSELSFELQETTIYEDVETLEVKILLDKPAPEDLILEFDVDGTATNKADIDPERNFYDFEIMVEDNALEIAEGETEATISIKLISDPLREDAETIILTLEDVDSENDRFEISDEDELAINLVNEDGTVVALVWDNTTADVDMDLIFWGKEEGELKPFPFPFSWAAARTVPNYEIAFYPNSLGLADDTYAFSYTYYSGSSDSLVFEVVVAEYKNGQFEDEEDMLAFAGLYRQENINAYDPDNPTFVIAQTFDMENSEFKNFSPSDTIIAAATSSRVNTHRGFFDEKTSGNSTKFLNKIKMPQPIINKLRSLRQ